MAANDYGSLEEGKKWWQKKVLSEEDRMRVNGETKAQMEYAQAVKDNGGVSLKEGESKDTSQDQPWEYEDKPYTDNYVLITTAIWLLPKLIVFLPVMLILNVVPVVLCRFFMAMMPEPTDRVQRNPVFYAWFTIALICSLPAMLVIVLSYLLDSIVYYFFFYLVLHFHMPVGAGDEQLRKDSAFPWWSIDHYSFNRHHVLHHGAIDATRSPGDSLYGVHDVGIDTVAQVLHMLQPIYLQP
jgi:hypothetical protein